MDIKQHIAWIAVDWGTTQLRAYAMSTTRKMLAQVASNKGVSSLSPGQFENTLIALIQNWLPAKGQLPVLACGMVGAAQGWKQTGYQTIPCEPLPLQNLTKVSTADPRIQVFIVPGICQTQPADVMRGEETQLAGLLLKQKINSACICLPGTHSKWVTINKAKVTNFSTFMTGEIFSLLCEHSILCHSVSAIDWDGDAFIQGVKDAAKPQTSLLNQCFNIRAKDLLHKFNSTSARSRLSGLLIGSELVAARDYWQKKPIFLVGEQQLTMHYESALSVLEVETQTIDSSSAIREGLGCVYQSLTNKEEIHVT